MISKSWRISPVDLSLALRLADELQVSRVLAEVLVRRGFTSSDEARTFLQPDCLFHDPYLLYGASEARARIDIALTRGQRILVFGDYDADGVTAAFLLTDVLQDMGADVSWRLPNRFRDGYGLSPAVVEEAVAGGAQLLITVDCGCKDVEAIDRAVELGLDVIVTDHHELGERLPNCIVVTPKLGDYPFPGLAGVGVALKLAHALHAEPGGPARIELPLRLWPYVDVAALGTVADVAPLLGENRALVAMGIGRLKSCPRPGLAALLEVSGVTADAVTADTISFRLAPRINAAGRLDDPSLAMQLLQAPDRHTALPPALRLGELNAARQDLEREILEDALDQLPAVAPPAIVLHSPDWHQGVVGIVASRLAERLGRPAVLLCSGAEIALGSGRSVPGFDLIGAVRACSEPLIGYGGHPAACGLRLLSERIVQFSELLQGYAGKHLPPEPAGLYQPVDAIVSGTELTLLLAEELERLAPYGEGNPRVSLLLPAAELQSPRRTRDGRHLQCRVRCDGACASAIHFNFEAEQLPAANDRFDVVLELARNSYNGTENAQIRMRRLYNLSTAAHDLCQASCGAACPDRMRGDELWRAVTEASHPSGSHGLGPPAPAWVLPQDGSSDALDVLTAAGRVLDARGRPVVPLLGSLLANGGRALLLVADVARRRPLLTRDLPLAALGRHGMYLSGACLPARLPLALAGGEQEQGEQRPDVVVAGTLTAALRPELVAAFDTVVFLDPPFTQGVLQAVSAACSGSLALVWGAPEVHFTSKVAAADYDLDAVLRRLWRALPRAAASAAAALEHEVFLAGPYPAKLPVLVTAWRTLRETGLVAEGGGKKEVTPDGGKVDLSTSASYCLWHQRFQSAQYLSRCLSTTS